MRAKIAVVGAGAVGCYYGGMLARAGFPVTLVGRPLHIEPMLREGLLLEAGSFRGHVPVHAAVDSRVIQGARLVLCCVKSNDTEAAARHMAPYLDKGSLVLCLQNGVDNAVRLQDLLPCPVATAAVYVAAEMAGPGYVRHHGRGDLVIGAEPAGEQIAQLFRSAEIPVEVSSNIEGELWAKLVINCAYNALSAITRLPYGRFVGGEGMEGAMRAVVGECLAVAQADGVQVPGITWDAVRGIADAMPAQMSSTAHDLARGKRCEIDHLNGYVVRRGKALGIAVPANELLFAIVRQLEQKHAVQAG
jgi:2-dehydropantoate 2-reductase